MLQCLGVAPGLGAEEREPVPEDRVAGVGRVGGCEVGECLVDRGGDRRRLIRLLTRLAPQEFGLHVEHPQPRHGQQRADRRRADRLVDERGDQFRAPAPARQPVDHRGQVGLDVIRRPLGHLGEQRSELVVRPAEGHRGTEHGGVGGRVLRRARRAGALVDLRNLLDHAEETLALVVRQVLGPAAAAQPLGQFVDGALVEHQRGRVLGALGKPLIEPRAVVHGVVAEPLHELEAPLPGGADGIERRAEGLPVPGSGTGREGV